MMRIKIDENLPISLRDLLTSLGHDAHHVEDEGLRSRPDTDVAEAAKREARVLLTLDIEFADIRKHPPGSHPGIVLFRSANPGTPAINQLVVKLLGSVAETDLAGAVTVVEEGRLRIRK
jgi:predicted nuclease of predicted toxin-antitoxin system